MHEGIFADGCEGRQVVRFVPESLFESFLETVQKALESTTKEAQIPKRTMRAG